MMMKSDLVRLGTRIVFASLLLGSPVLAQGPQQQPSGPSPHGGGARGAPAAQQEEDDGPDVPPQEPPHGKPGAPAGHGNSAANEMFQPPEDGAIEDPTIPTGVLDIHIADFAGKPMPNTAVTLGILFNSVAKGESRKRVTVTTNDKGVARVEHLDTGSAVAYRPMVMTSGATFSVMPFRMPEKMGMRAILHVYPVVDDIEQSLVVAQSIIYTEIKDDRVQVQQAIKIFNFGKNAWVPKELLVPLPEAFTGFSAQQGMTDIGIDAVPKQGVRIHGTFGPGQHMLEFRWQLPYSGEAEVHFDVGMAPHTAASRVIAPASKAMVLEVPGFPPPQPTSDGQGQRALITEKQIRREDKPLSTVTIVIKGLPTEGPGKFIATFVAAGGLLAGLVLSGKKPPKRDRKNERGRLLLELEDLERAHLAGDVGPKTYERARREILDAIARTFTTEQPATKAATKTTKRRSV